MVLYRHHIDQIQKEFFTCSRLFTNKKAMKFLDLCYCRLGQNSIFVTVTRKSKRNWPNLVWCSTDTLYTRYKRKFSPTTAHWLIKEDFGLFRFLLFALCVLYWHVSAQPPNETNKNKFHPKFHRRSVSFSSLLKDTPLTMTSFFKS